MRALFGARHSIRSKITALLVISSLLALSLTAVAMIVYTLRDYRQSHLADVRTQAQILAKASSAALAFNDRKEALQSLEILSARADIERAAIYDNDGHLFASYLRTPSAAVPAKPADLGHSIVGDKLMLFYRVEQEGESLGTVFLESNHRLAERLTGYAKVLAAVMSIALLASLAVSFWLQRVVTDPILGMLRAANSVVERGDFSVRAPKASDDEVGALADAFNRMLDEIGQRTAALTESEQRFRTLADSAPVLMWLNDKTGAVFVNRAYLDYLGVSDQVDVRGYDWAQFVHPDDRVKYVDEWLRCAEQQVRFDMEFRFRHRDGEYRWMRSVASPRRSAEGRWLGHTGCTFDVHDARVLADALRDADHRKDEFLATLAHELRNPLAPIRTAVHLMTLDGKAAARPDIRHMLERQVSHMVRLIDDLIDVSRISRGKVQLKCERVELADLLPQAVELSRPLIERAGHRLSVALPAARMAVIGDRVRLSQVIANLLNNAAKYTPEGGDIELGVRCEGDQALIAVRDTGIGLAPEDSPHVFEMFCQLENGKEIAQGGLGIGLALAKQLVQLHGGSIGVQSDGPGRGSCFTIRLPLAQDVGALPSAAGSAPDAPNLALKRVLVVDDNKDAADSLAMVLESLGAVVDVAHSGPQALDAFERLAPEFLLLDLGMPGMNGLEVAQQVRGLPNGHRVTLVAITGWGQEDDQRRTRLAGFDHHLVKPVDVKELQAIVALMPSSETPNSLGESSLTQT